MKKKKEKIAKAYICYEINDHDFPAIHTVYEVHVALTAKANKQAMRRVGNWLRKRNNTDESIRFFQEKGHTLYYFKEFELNKDFFIYDNGPEAVLPSSRTGQRSGVITHNRQMAATHKNKSSVKKIDGNGKPKSSWRQPG
jgi:hypothetical protein